VTTPEPGDRLVLMYGATISPASTAFFASSPESTQKHIIVTVVISYKYMAAKVTASAINNFMFC
jgi:hypothetical protein